MSIKNNQHLDLLTLAVDPNIPYYQLEMFLIGGDFEGLIVVSPVNRQVHITYSAFRGPYMVIPQAGDKSYKNLQDILLRFLPSKIGELELSIDKSVISHCQGIGLRIFPVPVMTIEEEVNILKPDSIAKLKEIRDYCAEQNIQIK